MQPLVRCELVIINVPAGAGGAGSSLPFPDVPTLNGVKVTGIRFFSATQMPFTPDRVPTLPLADAINTTLTINEGSDQRIKQIPLTDLITQQVAGVWTEFDPFQPDWQKSFIQFNAAVTAGTQAPFLFHYVRQEDCPELWHPKQ